MRNHMFDGMIPEGAKDVVTGNEFIDHQFYLHVAVSRKRKRTFTVDVTHDEGLRFAFYRMTPKEYRSSAKRMFYTATSSLTRRTVLEFNPGMGDEPLTTEELKRLAREFGLTEQDIGLINN